MKIILIIVGCLVALPGLAIVYALTVLGYNSYRLGQEAKTNAAYLNEITIITGKPTLATAEPNGDGLTGTSSPAKARFEVSDSLSSLYTDVKQNLSKVGYTMDNRFVSNEGQHYITNSIVVKATKGKATIIVRFYLEKELACDSRRTVKSACYYPESIPLESTTLYSLPIKQILVNYDPKEDPSYLF